jgi:hypothetical protein
MSPEMTTINPAPAESDASVTRRVQPVGAPRTLGSSVNEYLSFGDANREFRVTPFRELLQLGFCSIAEGDITRSIYFSRDLLNFLDDGLVRIVRRSHERTLPDIS